MYLGDIIEYGPTDDLVTDPKHPYTQELIEAVPRADPTLERQRANVTGEVPSARDPPSGCKFHPRCPEIIPPERWQGTQEAYRRLAQFRNRIANGELDPESVGGTGSDSRKEVIDQVLSEGMVLEVPEEHRKPGEDPGEGVDLTTVDLPADGEEALRDATRNLLEGDREGALERIDRDFESICGREHPSPPSETADPPACHLYLEPGEGTRTLAPEG